MTPERLEKRIEVTRTQIEAFGNAFLAHQAEKRPDNVPEWAWKAELDGIVSILADLRDELFNLEQERWNGALLVLETNRSADSDAESDPKAV